MILIVTVIFKVLLLCMFSPYTVLETSFKGEYISDMSLLLGTLLVCDNDKLPRWRNEEEEKGE